LKSSQRTAKFGSGLALLRALPVWSAKNLAPKSHDRRGNPPFILPACPRCAYNPENLEYSEYSKFHTSPYRIQFKVYTTLQALKGYGRDARHRKNRGKIVKQFRIFRLRIWGLTGFLGVVLCACNTETRTLTVEYGEMRCEGRNLVPFKRRS